MQFMAFLLNWSIPESFLGLFFNTQLEFRSLSSWKNGVKDYHLLMKAQGNLFLREMIHLWTVDFW